MAQFQGFLRTPPILLRAGRDGAAQAEPEAMCSLVVRRNGVPLVGVIGQTSRPETADLDDSGAVDGRRRKGCVTTANVHRAA